jgi:triosephosphate isomerase (TIM)
MAKTFSVFANWKMQCSREHVDTFFAEFKKLFKPRGHTIAICPPYPYIAQVSECLEVLKGIDLGAQDVSEHKPGACTGQVAAEMLVDMGCKYVIVGHSERRQYNHETDDVVAHKFFAAKAAGLIPILCVGETQSQREQGLTESIVLSQIKNILLKQGAKGFKDAIIAYEPIWAIGTGLSATPAEADAVHLLLRETIAEYDAPFAQALPIIYGGSVKANNAKDLFVMPNINGALVGGASLQAGEFWRICEAANF